VDTEGVISTQPVIIRKIVLNQNAAGDAMWFNFWLESDTKAYAKVDQVVVVTNNDNKLTGTAGFLSANVAPNQILKITRTASGNDVGYWQISADGANNNQVTVDVPASVYGQNVTLANANEAFCYDIWDARALARLKGSAITGSTETVELDFGDYGFWVPNLAMHTMTANANAHIFLK
jgi:hypothetical protein